MSDQRMAAVLTYVRRAWGNWADPIDGQLVARTRQESAGRSYPWTVQELLDVEAGKISASDVKEANNRKALSTAVMRRIEG